MVRQFPDDYWGITETKYLIFNILWKSIVWLGFNRCNPTGFSFPRPEVIIDDVGIMRSAFSEPFESKRKKTYSPYKLFEERGRKLVFF